MSIGTAQPVVGFIGLGDQGLPMATAIAEAGYPLHVWARHPASLDGRLPCPPRLEPPGSSIPIRPRRSSTSHHTSRTLWRISMKMSSRRSGLKRGSVAEHRPEDVDSSARRGDHGLGMPLTLGPLAVVEGPGLGNGAHTGEGRLVEDPLEDPVAAAALAMVAHPLARVPGGGEQPGLGGEPVGASEGGDVAHGDEELGPEDRPHARKAGEDSGPGSGAEAASEFPVELVDALLEGKDAAVVGSAAIARGWNAAPYPASGLSRDRSSIARAVGHTAETRPSHSRNAPVTPLSRPLGILGDMTMLTRPAEVTRALMDVPSGAGRASR